MERNIRKNRFLLILFFALFLLVACTPTNVANELGQSENEIKEQVPNVTTSKQNELAQNKQEIVAPPPKVEKKSKSTDVTKNELNVHFIDVGQGASQLIIGPSGRTILIDAGNNDKESLVVDYLKKQGISKIDILIGTHTDADHIGGLDAVIDKFDIGKIYMPKVQSNTKTFEDVLLAIQRKRLKVTSAKAGLTLDWEPDATVEMIAPVAQYSDTNDMSTVIHLTYGQTSF